jgi:phosphate transport system permease protein
LRERAVEGVVFSGGMASIVLVALIFLFVLKEALPLLKDYPLSRFLTDRGWQPTLAPPEGPWFGLLPNVWGSFLVTAGAVVLSVPLALSTAVFTSEVAPSWLRDMLKPLVELLASVPSVAIGFVGAVAINPLVKDLFGLDTGKSAIAGSIMLAFMAAPTIATIAEDAINAVPRSFRDGSLALGATRWQGISGIVLPAAKPGILAAVMLGVGRAVGETMVVIMVTGNAGVLPDKGIWYAFTHSVRTITGTIGAEALEVANGEPHYRALFMLGVVLFTITFVLNAVAHYSLGKGDRRAQA